MNSGNGGRRWALALVACTVSAALALGCDDDDDDVEMGVMPAPDGGADAAAMPNYQRGSVLREPVEMVSSGGVLQVTLTAQQRLVEVGGVQVQGTVFNQTFVGPTLRVRPGDRLEVLLENQLRQPLNLHFHGMHVDPGGISDNVFITVQPGTSQQYVVNIPADHAPGVYWYHSHLHHLSEGQVFGGLSGTLIVEGMLELLPAELRTARTRLLALKDLQVENGVIPADNIDSNAPTTRTVNAQVEPTFDLFTGETQRWQLANIGADIFYNVAFDGHTLLVVGEDGSPVSQVWSPSALVLPPGKRYEVLVKGGAPGTTPCAAWPTTRAATCTRTRCWPTSPSRKAPPRTPPPCRPRDWCRSMTWPRRRSPAAGPRYLPRTKTRGCSPSTAGSST